MSAILFRNAMDHDQVLNLELVTSVEVGASASALVVYFGKEHMNINFKSSEDRNTAFQEICEAYGVKNSANLHDS